MGFLRLGREFCATKYKIHRLWFFMEKMPSGLVFCINSRSLLSDWLFKLKYVVMAKMKDICHEHGGKIDPPLNHWAQVQSLLRDTWQLL